MDIENKNQLTDICILSLLKKEGCYGYYILKSVREFSGDINESVLYCILKRLEEAGMLAVSSSEYNARLRKYYSLTDQGETYVSAFLEKWKDISAAYNFIVQDRNEKKRRWL